MTSQGVIVLALIGFAYILWIINLVRGGKLHVTYGVLWIFWVTVGVLIVAIPPVLGWVTTIVGAVFPASALSLLAFGLLFAMQIYLLSQLSVLSRRIALIAQHIAIVEADRAIEED
ncbi:MAG: hypothetical protein Kow0063_25940 [Anaerolineae bacterium]